MSISPTIVLIGKMFIK